MLSSRRTVSTATAIWTGEAYVGPRLLLLLRALRRPPVLAHAAARRNAQGLQVLGRQGAPLVRVAPAAPREATATAAARRFALGCEGAAEAAEAPRFATRWWQEPSNTDRRCKSEYQNRWSAHRGSCSFVGSLPIVLHVEKNGP